MNVPPGLGSARIPLFMTPPRTIAIRRSTHSGSNSGSASLVEQRVAPGQQEHVEVALAGEPGEHRRLVHPGADRPDDPLLAQPVERRVRAVDGRLPVIVRVVDVRDVDALQAEALEALLDRPADAVRL